MPWHLQRAVHALSPGLLMAMENRFERPSMAIGH